MIYTQTDAENLKSLIKEVDGGVKVSLETLGGINRASLYILICLDNRETWPHKIMENSRYARFSIYSHEHKIEMFSSGWKLPKFRKVKCDTVEKIAEKLNAWIDKCEELKNSNVEAES